MATVIGIDPETQQQHQLTLYTAPLLVEFGIKHIPGQIYVAVVGTKADRLHEVVPYDSTIPEHGKQFPIVFVHRIIGCIISPIDCKRIKVGVQVPGPGGYRGIVFLEVYVGQLGPYYIISLL